MIIIFGFEIPKNYIEFILFGFTFVGGVLGFFLKILHIRYQTYCSSLMESGDKLKLAFEDTIDCIDNALSLDTLDMNRLIIEFNRLEKAIKVFQVNLSKSRRGKLRKAWEEYRRKDDSAFHSEYEVLDFRDKKLIKKKCKCLQRRINKILQFTKPIFLFTE